MTTFAPLLLRWYKKEGRDLPWRKTTDPYAIWVSEILLQQTQVATVLPYYRSFLTAFPTVRDLAAAPLDSVLKVWQGLGYYARARHLLNAARIIMSQWGGVVPSSRNDLCSLPGIGRSTAGAILNIAFHQRHPILDGNVKRVLIRYFCITEKQQGKKLQDRLWHLSEQILPLRRVDCFTQAIMDLGATICLPQKPQCTGCPLIRGCLAYQKGLQNRLPRKMTSKKIPHFDYVAAVLQKGDRVLIKKRPEQGLLGGLWEFPGGKALKSSFGEVMRTEAGRDIIGASEWFQVKHTFSHFKMTLHLFRGKIKNGRAKPPLKWVSIDRLEEYPFSSAHEKVVAMLTR